MQATQSTSTEPRHPSLPASLKREDIEALKVQRDRMKGDCWGYSPALRAAMAWIVAATVPDARASQLATWADAHLWQATKAAHKQDSEALHTLPDSVLVTLTWGESISLLWGLRRQTASLPIGPDPYSIIDAASAGFGTAIAGLVHKVRLPPLEDLQWRQLSSPEAPYRPKFTNWLTLPWLPDQLVA